MMMCACACGVRTFNENFTYDWWCGIVIYDGEEERMKPMGLFTNTVLIVHFIECSIYGFAFFCFIGIVDGGFQNTKNENSSMAFF